MLTMNSQKKAGGFFAARLRPVAIAGMAALTMGAATMAATAPAEAHWRHHDGAIVGGVIGGLALGAIVGSALAEPPPPPPAYYRPAYERPLPACRNFRHVDWRYRVWYDVHGRAHPCR